MNENFFIGREKELRSLEEFALSGANEGKNPTIAHVCGEKGIGKTSFIQAFANLFPEEPNALVWFSPEISDGVFQRSEDFFYDLIRSSDSNIGDFETLLEELRSLRKEIDGKQSNEFFWSEAIGKFVEKAQGHEYIQTGGLNLIFVVDNFTALTADARNAFCIFINRLQNTIGETTRLHVTLSGEDNLLKIPGIWGYWESPLKSALEIKLEGLSKDETVRLLDTHDIDATLASKIHANTQGVPLKILEALNDQGIQNINSEEWYTRGANLMLQFNDFQRKWLLWAAALKTCNDETLSFLAKGRELSDVVNWVHSNYPQLFAKDQNNYTLAPDYRRAVIAFLKKDNPKLYKEISEIVQRFNVVRHTIPNRNHRRILSLLSEFRFFDIELIRKIFDEDTANDVLILLENKPIFFREEELSYRLASNIRTSIHIYNELLDPQGRDVLQRKIELQWENKSSKLNDELLKKERQLHENEEKNRSLSISLGKMEDEITRLKKSGVTKQKPPVKYRKQKSQSGFRLFIGLILQIIGISILYADILVFENVTFSYISISIMCIIGGIVYSLKGGKTKLVKVESTTQTQQQEKLAGIIKNLELDRISLVSQKEETRNKIEGDKLAILKIQAKLKQSYMSVSGNE